MISFAYRMLQPFAGINVFYIYSIFRSLFNMLKIKELTIHFFSKKC